MVADRRLDRVGRACLHAEAAVERGHVVEPPTLSFGRLPGPDVAKSGVGIAGKHRGLRVAGQKPVAEAGDTAVGHAGVAAFQDDVSRQFVALAAQPVDGPGAGAREPEKRKTGVHEEVALGMLAELRRHRPDDGEFVGVLRHLGKQVADLGSAFAPWPKRPLRRHEQAVVVELRAFDRSGQRLSGVRHERRLWIERIDVRNAAAHEQEDHPLRACFQGLARGDGLPAENACKSRHAKPGRRPGKKLPPRGRARLQAGLQRRRVSRHG